jgi:predicted deacylase
LSILKRMQPRPRTLAAGLACLAWAAAASGSTATVAPAAQQGEWCKRLAVRLPGVSARTCQSSGLAASGAVSQKGFPILTRRVPPGKGAPSHPVRVLLLGGIHGDELTASAVVFQWMQWMQTPEAQQLN